MEGTDTFADIGMAPLASLFQASDAVVLTVAGVFTRIAAATFFVPGIGERVLSLRLRLGAALALTALLWPLVRPLVPDTPSTVPGLAVLLIAEAFAGLLIGFGFRMLVFALQIAGITAAYHLSITHVFGTGVAPEPEPTIATMLTMGGIVLAMQAGLHIELLAALARLYDVLPFGRFPNPGDAGAWSLARTAEVFGIGLSLAFPFIAVSFAYNLALGALNRAMPQLLVALVGAPLLIGLGLVTLALVLPDLFARWGDLLARIFADPLGGP
ncbi:MAG: flagellar biosynthetic protein FliR [Pseudomonadota bacterium]